jgi:ribonuclease Y
MDSLTIMYILLALIIGVVVGRYLLRQVFKKKELSSAKKAKQILKDAENEAEH